MFQAQPPLRSATDKVGGDGSKDVVRVHTGRRGGDGAAGTTASPVLVLPRQVAEVHAADTCTPSAARLKNVGAKAERNDQEALSVLHPTGWTTLWTGTRV